MFITINILQQFGRRSFPLSVLLFLILWTFMSCKNEYEGFSVNKDEAYQLNVPEGFPKMTFDVLGNPITVNGVALGKKLFYEGNSPGIIQSPADSVIFRNMPLPITGIPLVTVSTTDWV